jgi:AbrB family looped-hinge helix DNA binding protein
MSKVTAKYQITIPPKIRRAMNIMPGVEIGFKEIDGQFFLVKTPAIHPINKWRGAAKTAKTVDETVAELRGYGIESVD